MNKYDWILFDADETLFHFDAFAGLQRAFARFGVVFTKEDYEHYHQLNHSLWIEYQNGNINPQELQHRRLCRWAEKLNVTSQHLNDVFHASMVEICQPLEGAISLLDALKPKAKLGIITNGFADMQQVRLEKTGLQNHFELLVISELVGYAKPHRGIFDHALEKMGTPERERVLMVGDNPEADILGGMNAGIHTCWLNVNKKSAPNGIKPHYEVSSLSQLEELLIQK